MTKQDNAGMDLKSKNRNDIYKLLWRESRLSKQAIIQALGLSLPTVTNNLADLCREGLVKENGSFGRTGGRNAKGYSINPSARFSVGVDVNKTHIAVVVTDLCGNGVYSFHEHRPYKKHADYYRRVGELTVSAIQKTGITSEKLLGVGISVQGLLSADRSEVIFGPILDNKGETAETIAQYIPHYCELFHDAESAAFAELWVSPELANGVYVSLSTNLGGAVIIDRNIFQGDGFTAGKLEHMTLHPGGRLCYCGKQGCADCYCSLTHLTESIGDGTLGCFFDLLGKGDEKAVKRFREYMDDLAILVNSIYMLLDSDVILGGYITRYMAPYIDELKALAYGMNGVLPGQDYIKLARFETEAVAAGAALRFVDRFINSV